MIRLLPITTSQTFSILPRNLLFKSSSSVYSDFESRITTDGGTLEESTCATSMLYDIYVNGDGVIGGTLTEDGTKISQTLSALDVVLNGSFVDVTFSSTILNEDTSYLLELTIDGGLWYRDKVYVTSLIDTSTTHTINTGKYIETDSDTDNSYITI